MLQKVFSICLFVLFISCTGDQSDTGLLQKDRKALVESLDSQKVLSYKFTKICLRATATEDTISEEFQDLKHRMYNVSQKIAQFNKNQQLSIMDYISIYKEYRAMSSFIEATDEDVFPTTVEALERILAIQDTTATFKPLLKGDQKIKAQNMEHAVLSALVILSKDLGKEISLYECAKTTPEALPDGELKSLLHFFRGFLFFEKKLYYLSEDEITQNINWLEQHPTVALPFAKSLFKWQTLNNQQTYTAYHSLQYLFRGFDRLMMDRDVDEQRALNDFEIFLQDSKKLGLENEIIWGIETYLYLKNEEHEKAIAALTKLNSSPLLSKSERESISETITYLKHRDTEALLNGVYDKYFLSKIAVKYMYNLLSQVDWKTHLKEHDVPYTDEIFELLYNFQQIDTQLEKQLNGESLKETGKLLKDQGSKLWEKSKELIGS